jgi:hypothetical protein
MANLSLWLLEAAAGEHIEAVVIGELGWGGFGHEQVPSYDQQPKNKVLTWAEALPWIDYEFDDGFGAPSCNAIHAWTANKVIFVSQYDGSTSVESVPRNPSDAKPEMPGG